MAGDISTEIGDLRRRLEKLKAQQLRELRTQRKKAQRIIDDLDAQIAAITGGHPTPTSKRARTSPDEMRTRIFGELQKHSENGLSQMQIAQNTGLNYVSVALFLKRNRKDLRITGKLKEKRYFLKQR